MTKKKRSRGCAPLRISSSFLGKKGEEKKLETQNWQFGSVFLKVGICSLVDDGRNDGDR
jgi:hypothetical protein